VLAIGVFGVYIKLGWVGKFWAVAMAHAMLALPYVFVNVLNGLMTYDERLDRAAESLGARPWQLLAWVRLPVLGSALGSAAAFAFLVSFDELVLTLFLGSFEFKTLPILMWSGANQGLSPELAVVGTLLIAVSMALWLVVIRGRSKRILANVEHVEGIA
jgi:ABC-type spermidine/putrescine transport system permease subunit II